jgi:DNA-binding HxlR family transcriptional regulator
VVYALTDRGESFRSVLEAMATWGDADLQLSDEQPNGRSRRA